MSLVERTTSYIFSSDPANGAKNRSADGSTFSVQLDSPIAIPKSACHAELSVTSANIWWTVSNISAAFNNNKLYLYSLWADPVTGVPAGSPNWTITLEDGLYSVDGLNSQVSRALANLGLPSNLIIVGGDDSTQKSVFTYNGGGYATYLDFTQADTPRDLLGFSSRESPLAANQSDDGYHDFGDVVAEYNTISSFLINTDLVSDGVPLNNVNGGVISNVKIGDTRTGYLINYEPFNPDIVSANELIGSQKSNFTFRLTDQSQNLTDTNSEYWSFTIVIKYWIPVHTNKPGGMHAGSHG